MSASLNSPVFPRGCPCLHRPPSPPSVVHPLFVQCCDWPCRTPPQPPAAVGSFDGHGDVGTVLHAGSATFDAGDRHLHRQRAAARTSGAPPTRLHFVWTKLEGDVAIEADVAFAGAGKNAHRKAMLMIRQGLEADAAYVDAAVHGDGLTSIQFRADKGGQTQEVQANVAGPARVRIEKQGDYARLYVAEAGAAAALLRRRGARRLQRAALRRPRGLRPRQGRSRQGDLPQRDGADPRRAGKPPVLYSTLETVPLGTGSTDRRVQYVSTTRFEAPNWFPDGKAWLVNSGGRLLKIPMGGGAVETVNTGSRTRNNNDHGISKDGSTIVISDQSEGATATGGGPSRIYTLPIAGGEPTLVTPNGAVLLARHLAGRQDARLLRPAQRRVRRLHDPRRRGRGDAADYGERPRRRPRVLARRPVDLLQLGAHRPDADLEDEAGWQRADAR